MSDADAPTPPVVSRRFPPTPVETSVKKIRRFAPEPVETTARSSKKEDGKQPPAEKKDDGVDKKDFAPKRRFVPEPVETTFKSSKQPKGTSTAEPTSQPVPERSVPTETPKPRRRFAPELIETTTRTKKAGDRRPATLPTDKTDLTPGVPNIYTRSKKKSARPPVAPLPGPPDNTPNTSYLSNSQILPIPPRRQQSMRPHPNTRRSTRRQDSFQPELEVIESSESGSEEEEDYDEDMADSTPSLTGSNGSSDDSYMRLQLARTRESCDDRFSGYLLALAAKAAEKQLREQALAAFPNESSYEIVEHFYDREIDAPSDEEVVEGIGMLLDERKPSLRRKSTEVGWHVQEMQHHQENLNRMREDETNKKIADEATKNNFQDPFWTNGMNARPEIKDPKKEAELERMRKAASPPMLGGDLKFRMCPSPKATKFESDQRIDIQPKRDEHGGGLWGGYCVAEEPEKINGSIKRPTWINTPKRDDPFSHAFARSNGTRMLVGIEERLKLEAAKAKAEEAIRTEFNDNFVTQVYNYLSLGYPSLARPYDNELARIAHVAPEDLRKDDGLQDAKGHIGLMDAPGAGGKGEKCARWEALKIYILEWGRQHPNMSNGASTPSAWGVRARRGSWAI
ncbi:hypothetical protein HYFRA_00014020 [Hymenoscyphus fraxineus]|uniref:Uncharacterized protein n=1 Tax=Hymenoscyphus fraxineus TaxID=746836 RepID=A0A9N9L9B5_9HELO|nr:hypothetical protein HYFRA_00014020 [Hymenoscyphus fraxineus]